MNNNPNTLQVDYPVEENIAQETWYEKLQSIISLSEVLRIFGACAVLASMSLFLLNGWSEVNDISRYLKLLTQTGLLTLAGVALSVGLKEYKGARLFFGLGLVSVVANFTILGALVYSMLQWDSALTDYPVALTWQVVEWRKFLPVFAGASLVLVFLSRFSFSIFARRHAGLLTVAFLVLSALLMLPIRNSMGVSVLVVTSMLFAFKVAARIWNEKGFVATPEAKFSLAVLFLPALIILTRAMALYHVDEMLALTLSALGYFALRAYSLQDGVAKAQNPSAAHRISDLLQLGLAFNIALQISSLVARESSVMMLALFCIALLALATEVVLSGRHPRARTEFVNWSVVVMAVVASSAALLSDQLDIKLVAWLSTCLVLAFNAVFGKELLSRLVMNLSICATLLTSIWLLVDFVDHLNLHNWVLIGVIGGALILTASFYERFGLKLVSRSERL